MHVLVTKATQSHDVNICQVITTKVVMSKYCEDSKVSFAKYGSGMRVDFRNEHFNGNNYIQLNTHHSSPYSHCQRTSLLVNNYFEYHTW